MTSAENERLAVVENEVRNLNKTVGGMDVKLDTVIVYMAGQQAKEAAGDATSAFHRWLIPAALTVINGILTALTAIRGL